ncbi:4Fe-4S binding protein [uncultured Eubacterium sp.]
MLPLYALLQILAGLREERCVGCGKCAKLCPVGCIEVKVRADA